MIQTAVLILLLIGAAMVAQANLDVLHSQLRVAFPGLTGVPLTFLRSLMAIAAALLALWIAGLIDLAIARAQIRNRAAAVRAMEGEVRELKSTAFDRQRSALDNIERGLDLLAQEVRNAITRRDAQVVVESQHPIRPDLTPGAVRTVRERVTIARTRDNSIDE